MRSPWIQHGVALLTGALGTLGVVALVLTINSAPPRQPDGDRSGEVQFAVQPPTPKKKPAQRRQRQRPRRQPREAPPAPVVGADLSGMSFGLDALAGALGDMDALLGDVGDVVMTAETVDELPAPLRQVAPQPPARARAKGIEGLVVVSVLIGADGSVQRAQIVESRPPGVFDEAVVAAVEQWSFRPAMYQGQPVPLRVDYPFRFAFN